MTWLKAKNNEKSKQAHIARTQRWRARQKEIKIKNGTYKPRGRLTTTVKAEQDDHNESS